MSVGGNSTSSALNDTWEDTYTIPLIDTSYGSTNYTQETTCNGESPTSRYLQACAVDPTTELIWCYG